MIFVSYSWTDSAFAQDIAILLSKLGYQTWIDYECLDLEKPLEPQIAKAILAANTFILVDSPDARASRWVQFELSLLEALKQITQIVCTPSSNSVRSVKEVVECGLLSSSMSQTMLQKMASTNTRESHMPHSCSRLCYRAPKSVTGRAFKVVL